MTTTKKSTSLQVILIQLRNDLELIERKWDTFTDGKVPNSGRANFLNGIQGYYRLRPTAGRQTFCIGDIAMVHDALHLHRRYNSRASVEKVLDVLVDLRLLRWNVERLLRTLSNTSNTVSSREKLLSLQNDTTTWKQVLDDKFSLVEMMAPSSPLFNRTLGDTLWRCVDTASMMANYVLEAIENQWPMSLQLMWRKLAAKEFNESAALENAVIKRRQSSGESKNSYQRRALDSKELDKLISRKQKLIKSMEADNRRKNKSDKTWEDSDDYYEDENDFSNELVNIPVVTKTTEPKEDAKRETKDAQRRGVKVHFDDETSMISTEGNVTVHIINGQDRNDSRLSYQLQPVQAYPVVKELSPTPKRATYIGSTRDEPDTIKTKPYMELVKDNDDNLVVIRRPQMEKQILLPSVNQPINSTPRVSTATLRPARVLLTEVPENSEPSVSTKDLKNIIEKVENLDGTVVDIHGDMRRELTRLRTSIKQRLRAVQQQVYEFDNTVDKVTNTMY